MQISADSITNAFARQKQEERKILTQADLNQYIKTFGIKPDELNRKLILDVGCGQKELFSRDSALYGGSVISLSPAYRLKKHRTKAQGKVKNRFDWQEKSVAARVQELPFQSNVFDFVFASNSVPYYLKLINDELLALVEMVRVTKPAPNGKVMIASYVRSHNKLSSSVITWLESLGCEINIPNGEDWIEVTKDGDLFETRYEIMRESLLSKWRDRGSGGVRVLDMEASHKDVMALLNRRKK